MRDVRFRQAVNMGLDREEIRDNVYLGFGTDSPRNPSIYDPEQAKALLDEMGMDQRDSDGWRLAPDGSSFELFIELASVAADWVPVAELMVEHISDLGIKTSMRTISAELVGQRAQANELMGSIDWMNDIGWPNIYNDFLPDSRTGYGRLWSQWYHSDGQEGEEPPEWVKEIYSLNEQIAVTFPETEERLVIEERLFEIIYEQIPFFIVARDVVCPMIVPPNVGNMAHSGQASAPHFAAEQMYFAD